MIASLLLLASTVLPTDFKTSPLFVYPSSFSSMALADEYVPGAVAYSNSVRRLTSQSNAAMLATPEAILERLVFPYVSRHGGGKSLSLSDLATASLAPGQCVVNKPASGIMTDETHGVPSGLYAASARDLSVAARRMTTANSVGMLYALEQASREETPLFDDSMSAWLVPDYANLNGLGEWFVNDQTKTAQWDEGFLLRLNEIAQSGVYDAATTPFPALPPLMPQKWAELEPYLAAASMPSLYSYFNVPDVARGESSKFFVRDMMHGSASPRVSGLASLDVLVRDAAPGLASADLPHVATNSTPRVWWEKFALWNALASNLRVRLDKIEPARKYYPPNAAAPSHAEMGFNPMMRYKRLESSTIMAFRDYTLALDENASLGALSQYTTVSESGGLGITTSIDLGYFSEGDVNTAGTSINVVTNYSPKQTTRYVNAWADSNPSLTISGTLNASVSCREVMTEEVCEAIDSAAREKGKTTTYVIEMKRIVASDGIFVKCNVYDMDGGASLKTFTFPMTTPLKHAQGVLRVQYKAGLAGRECIGFVPKYVSSTYTDGAPPFGTDENYCIFPSWFNDAFASGGILKSEAVHEFATAAITTNASAVADAAASLDDGLDYSSFHLVATDDDPIDSWFAYRVKTTRIAAGYSQHRAEMVKGFMAGTMDADVKGVFLVCPADAKTPQISDAINVDPSERLSAARESEGWGEQIERTVAYSSESDTWGGIANVEVTYDADTDQVDFIYTTTHKSISPYSSILTFATFTFPISIAAKHPLARPSAAVEISKDFMLQTEWKFPQLPGSVAE